MECINHEIHATQNGYSYTEALRCLRILSSVHYSLSVKLEPNMHVINYLMHISYNTGDRIGGNIFLTNTL